MKPDFKRHVHTDLIVQLMRDLTLDSPFISDEKIAATIDVPLDSREVYIRASSAARICNSENGCQLVRVRNQGWKLADNSETHDAGRTQMQRGLRQVKRSTKTLSKVKTGELPDAERLQFWTSIAIAGTVTQMAKAKTRDRVEAAVKSQAAAIEYGRVLEIMK